MKQSGKGRQGCSIQSRLEDDKRGRSSADVDFHHSGVNQVQTPLERSKTSLR